MLIERCDECGFDGGAWTEVEAIDEIGRLSARWVSAVNGLGAEVLSSRPLPSMWSIGEYVDHVRVVLFGMRFVLDIALDSPGTDLGSSPEPVFAPEAARFDIAEVLDQLSIEARQLRDRLGGLGPEQWRATVRFDGQDHDARWICRHAVHDANHHLDDVAHLRSAVESSAG